MNAKLMLLPALTIIGLAGYASVVRAESTMKSEVVSSLATKLGVGEDKVNAAFNEMHKERKEELNSKRENRLQELVDEGTLTVEQKDALVAKMTEMHEQHDKIRADFEEWARANGINLEELGPIGIGHGHFKMKTGPR